jgi:hypothetical protein
MHIDAMHHYYEYCGLLHANTHYVPSCMAGARKDVDPQLAHNQKVAAEAYVLYQQDKQAGLAYFDEHIMGTYGQGGNKLKLMQRHYGNRMQRQAMVPRGRPPNLPVCAVYAAMKVLVEGYTVHLSNGETVWRGYSSLKDALQMGLSPVLAEIQRDYNVSASWLWVRIKQLHPGILKLKHTVDTKSALTPAARESRQKAAATLQRWPIKKLARVVYLDAKKFYLAPGSNRVYTLNPDYVDHNPLIPMGKLNSGKAFHYYAAVNSLVGTVSLVWVTGTTGQPQVYTTMVSTPRACVVV